MKPIDVNQTHTLTILKKLMIKILNVTFVISLEYENIKTFLQNVIFGIGLKKLLRLKKLKTLCRRHMPLVILTEKKLLERFLRKNCKKQIKKGLEFKK